MGIPLSREPSLTSQRSRGKAGLIDDDAEAFFEFVELNRVIINAMLRQNIGKLETSMRAMLVFPECMRVLDFKVKRNYLKLKLRHLKRELEEKENENSDEEEYDDDMSCIDVEVDRERVLECSFEAIHNASAKVLLTRRLNIVFDDEEGVDAGGLTREWYSILTREIFRADVALFLCAADGITYQPNPHSSTNPGHLNISNLLVALLARLFVTGRA